MADRLADKEPVSVRTEPERSWVDPAGVRDWSGANPSLCSRPATIAIDHCRGQERHHDFVVASNGKSSRAGFGPARLGGWALHYVLRRPIVLNEIKICGCDRLQS